MLPSVYYGQIGQQDAERLLGKYGKDGSFLLRDSQSERGALCLCVRKAPFVHTYRIVNSPHGWAVETENRKKTQWFQSLDKLIESYKETPHNMVPLLYPLEKSHLHEEERPMRGLQVLCQNRLGFGAICDSLYLRATVQAAKKQPHSMILPPPSFTMEESAYMEM